MKKIFHKLKSFCFSSDGQSAVEFAYLLPLILLILFCIVNIGLFVNAQIIVTYAAREGAREGAVSNNDNNIRGRVQTAMRALQPTYTNTEVIITPSGHRYRGQQLSVRIEHQFTLPVKLDLRLPYSPKILTEGKIPIVSTAITRVEKD